MLPSKDTEERVTLTFDFSSQTNFISSPTVTVSLVSGVDSSPEDILDTPPEVYENNKIIFRVKDGVSGCNYLLRVKIITETGDILIIADILPIRTQPYIE